MGALCAYSVREPAIWGWLVKHRPELIILLRILNRGNARPGNGRNSFHVALRSLGYSWMSLFYSGILMLALTGPGRFLSRTMRRPGFAKLGEIGYGVCLFHLGIYALCLTYFTGHGWVLSNWKDFGVTLLAVAITFSAAKLSWTYFERPILRLGHSRSY